MPDNYPDGSSRISSNQKESIFMNMSDSVLILNKNQEVTYLNPACENTLGVKEQNVLNRQISSCLIQNRSNKSFCKLLQNGLKNSRRANDTIVTYDNGTEKRILNIKISPIKTNKEPEGMMVLMEDITAAHNLKKHERDCAMIFAGLVTCICVYLFAWSLIEFTLGIHLKTSVYTLMIEGIAFILFLEIIFFTSMKPKDIGIFVRPSRLLKTFKGAIPLAAAVCCLMLLLNFILRLTGHPVKSYFIGGSLQGAYTYLFTAIIQEFLSRGVIQTSVKALMQIKYQKFFSIFLTSLLFALMHLPFDFPFMAGAFLLSIALGIIYEKQENIWGCAFLHWSCGYLAMALFF